MFTEPDEDKVERYKSWMNDKRLIWTCDNCGWEGNGDVYEYDGTATCPVCDHVMYDYEEPE